MRFPESSEAVGARSPRGERARALFVTLALMGALTCCSRSIPGKPAGGVEVFLFEAPGGRGMHKGVTGPEGRFSVLVGKPITPDFQYYSLRVGYPERGERETRTWYLLNFDKSANGETLVLADDGSMARVPGGGPAITGRLTRLDPGGIDRFLQNLPKGYRLVAPAFEPP